jgi:hypothetical protein
LPLYPQGKLGLELHLILNLLFAVFFSYPVPLSWFLVLFLSFALLNIVTSLLTRLFSFTESYGESYYSTILPHIFFSLFLFFFIFYYSYVHTRLGTFLPLAPTPSLTTHSTTSLSLLPPKYPAETILPLFLILL